MDSAASTGLFMLCCLSVSPFIAGLFIGWAVRGRWDRGGWVGMLPGPVARRLVKWLEEE